MGNDDTLEDFDMETWLKKRKRATIAFILQSVALGMEYSLTFITLWLYLEKLIKTPHLMFFYSIISAAYLLSQVVMSITLSRVFDRYRNLEVMFLIGNILVISGNVLYTIPLSPWYLFAGRLVSGGGGCLRSIMTSELARSYPDEELSSKFSAMGMAFGLGFVAGPVLNFPFVKADFMFLGVYINYANAPGLILTGVFIAMQILAIFLVRDLSKEYDMKANLPLSDNVNRESEIDEISLKELCNSVKDTEVLLEKNKCEDSNGLKVFFQLFQHIDTCLLLAFSFFLMYSMVTFDLWQPITIVELMEWGVLELNLIIFGYGIAVTGVLLCFVYFPVLNKYLFNFGMVCVVALALLQVVFIIFKRYHNSVVLNVALWVIYDILFSIIVVMEEVFLIGTMAKMTSSSVQAFTESIRLSLSRTGALVALLTAAITFQKIEIICPIYIAISFFGLVILIMRGKHLKNPKPLIFA